MEDFEFKQPKNSQELIDYLSANLRVKFTHINKESAKDILEQNTYLNIITPFKHRFAKWQNNTGELINIDGKNVYERDVEFKEYFDLFLEERSLYPILYKSISKYELLMKSLISSSILVKHRITTRSEFQQLLFKLMLRIPIVYGDKKRRFETERQLKDAIKSLENTKNQFIFLDRLALGTLISIFDLLFIDELKFILNVFKQKHLHMNAESITLFSKFSYTLVSVRNTIMHSNSLEILVRYKNSGLKELRTSSDRKHYRKIIHELIKIHEKSQ